MKVLAKVTGFVMILLVIAAFFMIGGGFYQLYQTENVPLPKLRASEDSIVKTQVVNDTIVGNPGVKHSTTSTIIETIHGDHRICESCKPYSDDLIKARYDMAYKLLYTGVFIILLLLLLPSLHDFSILGLFSATFKDDIKDLKVLHNDAQQQLASSLQVGMTSNNKVRLQTLNIQDENKGKWGGISKNNSRELSASVTSVSGTVDEYLVVLTVRTTTPDNPLKGFVAFHLPDYFPNPSPKIFVIGGEANLKFRTTAAFIVGAETDAGLTKLELNLSTVPGFKKA